MNQRITDIAEHCDFYVGNEWYMETPEEKQRIWTEKFAELIIEECVDICYNTTGNSYLNGVAAGTKIMQHFGVKYEPAN